MNYKKISLSCLLGLSSILSGYADGTDWFFNVYTDQKITQGENDETSNLKIKLITVNNQNSFEPNYSDSLFPGYQDIYIVDNDGNEGVATLSITLNDKEIAQLKIEQRDQSHGEPNGYDQCVVLNDSRVNSYACYQLFNINPLYKGSFKVDMFESSYHSVVNNEYGDISVNFTLTKPINASAFWTNVEPTKIEYVGQICENSTDKCVTKDEFGHAKVDPDKVVNIFRVSLPQRVARLSGNDQASSGSQPFYSEVYVDGVSQGKLLNVTGMDMSYESIGRPLYNPMQFYVTSKSIPAAITITGESGPITILNAQDNSTIYSQPGSGQSSTWQGSGYDWVIQEDGNVVVYDAFQNPLWALWDQEDLLTDDHNATNFSFQEDGNLCARNKTDKIIWCSNTYQDGVTPDSLAGKYLILQADGNIVIYDNDKHPLWQTDTSISDQNEAVSSWTIPVSQDIIDKSSACGISSSASLAFEYRDGDASSANLKPYNNLVYPEPFLIKLKDSGKYIDPKLDPGKNCFKTLIFANENAEVIDSQNYISNLYVEDSNKSEKDNHSYILQASYANALFYLDEPVYGTSPVSDTSDALGYYYYTDQSLEDSLTLNAVLADFDLNTIKQSIPIDKTNDLSKSSNPLSSNSLACDRVESNDQAGVNIDSTPCSLGWNQNGQNMKYSAFSIDPSKVDTNKSGSSEIANPNTIYRNYQIFTNKDTLGLFLYDNVSYGRCNDDQSNQGRNTKTYQCNGSDVPYEWGWRSPGLNVTANKKVKSVFVDDRKAIDKVIDASEASTDVSYANKNNSKLLFDVNGKVYYYSSEGIVSREVSDISPNKAGSYEMWNVTSYSMVFSSLNIRDCSITLPADGNEIIFPAGQKIAFGFFCKDDSSLWFSYEEMHFNTMNWPSNMQVALSMQTGYVRPADIYFDENALFAGCIRLGDDFNDDGNYVCSFNLLSPINTNNNTLTLVNSSTYTLTDVYSDDSVLFTGVDAIFNHDDLSVGRQLSVSFAQNEPESEDLSFETNILNGFRLSFSVDFSKDTCALAAYDNSNKELTVEQLGALNCGVLRNSSVEPEAFTVIVSGSSDYINQQKADTSVKPSH